MTRVFDPIAWTRRAAGRDEMRPVLTGLRAEPGVLVATDGMRLHRWQGNHSLAAGLWKQNGESIDGQYPNYEQVFPVGKVTHEVIDPNRFLALVQAAAAANKAFGFNEFPIWLPCGDHGAVGEWADQRHVAIDATYLLDAIKPMATRDGAPDIRFLARGPLDPVKLELTFSKQAGADAIVMPIRGHKPTAQSSPENRFHSDLSSLVQEIPPAEQTAPAAAPEPAAATA